jgi:GDPmannose 4,6-dehydratase
MSKKTALILGISGQDGAHLARFLLDKSYTVIGQSRSCRESDLGNLHSLDVFDKIEIRNVSTLDRMETETLVKDTDPDEIYNFSGQSSVGNSFSLPIETTQSHVISTLHLLEAIRKVNKTIRFFNAGSSECFGDTRGTPANELTPFSPVSPYGISKAASTWYTSLYRENHFLYACTGIFFNHESSLRNERFVTKKIAMAAHRISNGSDEKISLGNVDVIRDWGWAQEYVQAAWKMLNRESPEDFVIATGVTQSLRAFAETVFLEAGLELEKHLNIDKSLMRLSEPPVISANISKARDMMAWDPKIFGAKVARKMYTDTIQSTDSCSVSL